MLNPQQIQSLKSSAPTSSTAGSNTMSASVPFQTPDQAKSAFVSSPTPSPVQKNNPSNANPSQNSEGTLIPAIKSTASNIRSDIDENSKMAENAATNNGTTKPSILDAIGPSILAAGKDVTDIGGEVAEGGTNFLANTISPFIPQDVKTQVGDKISSAKDAITTALNEPANGSDLLHNQQFRTLLDHFVTTAKDNPETMKTIGHGLAVILAPSGIEGGLNTAKTVLSAADKTGSLVKQGIDAITPESKTASESSVDTLAREGGQVKPDMARKSAWNDIQPKATPTTKLAYAKGGNTTAQGLVTSGKLTPTSADTKLLDSYQKLYEEGSIKDNMTPQQKQEIVSQKATQLNQQQKEFLASHDKAVKLTGTDLKGKSIGLFDNLDATAKRSSMPFSKDASTKGAYDSVIETYKSLLDTGKSAGTVQGASTLTKIDSALTNLDQEMQKYGAWGKAKTGEITDTAMARQQAIRDIHTTVRDYIASELPKNSPWQSIRMEESNMYQIGDRLAQRSADTVGTSKAGSFIKKNPIAKPAIQAAGMGAGLHLIP